MAKCIKRPIVVEVLTFDEFVECGRQYPGVNIVNGMPWSFKFKEYNITHENDKCYLIPTRKSYTQRFTPDDMLIIVVSGEIYPCKKDIFNETYTIVD